MNAGLRIVYGYLLDMFSFRFVFFFVNILVMISLVIFHLFTTNDVAFIIATTIAISMTGSLYTVYPPHIVKVYGYHRSSGLFAIICLGISFGTLVSSQLTHSIDDATIESYYLLFEIFMGVTLAALFLNAVTKEPIEEEHLLLKVKQY